MGVLFFRILRKSTAVVRMLFAKPISNLTFEDIEEFCRRFNENIRVEYKSTFDGNVKNKLPRVLSSFANSYGGIVIIGITARDGVPQEPYEGINFQEREPGLTVQNLCRDGIFPEIPLYTSLVPSRVAGKAFLVVQINESPRAPHAIENSTKVFVRTEASTDTITLADIRRIERMLLRRAEISRRWDDFFDQSWTFARSVNFGQKYAYREIRIGPLYPAESLLTREAIYDFLSNSGIRNWAGFHLGELLRTPIGALLARIQNAERFLNIGDIGILHYVEPCYPGNYQGAKKYPLDLFPMAGPILKMVSLAGSLIDYSKTSCDLQVQASLRNISGQSFLSGMDPHRSVHITTVGDSVIASTVVASHKLPGAALDVAIELMYQLRWPFGKEPAPTIEDVRRIVEKFVG